MQNVAPHPELTHQITPIVTPEVEMELMRLAAAYQAKHRTPVNRKTIVRAEYEAAYRHWWESGIPEKINYKYTMIALNRSAEAAESYLKSQFEELHPQYKDLEFPPGRPEGYMGPKKRFNHAQGAVIAELLARCGKELYAELTQG